MSERRVRFTETAAAHVESERAWWKENRDYQEVFATEVEQALRLVALLPGSGTLYPRTTVDGLRRIYLPKIACHLYYTFDDEAVIVRALWGSRRERGPSI